MEDAAVTSPESVVFVAPDKLGGALSIVADMLEHRAPDAFRYEVVLTHCRHSRDVRFSDGLNADAVSTIEHRLPFENLHSALVRLRRAIPPGDGVLVTADLLELALASAADLRRTVMMIVHGDYPYYYDLARRHDDVIDVFICPSRAIFDRMQHELPHRRDAIVHLAYGITIPPVARMPVSGPLRLVFVGRLDRQKGVFDLPEIDEALRASGVDVQWTIVGGGPEEAELRSRWMNGSVRWAGVLERSSVMELTARQDVFVLPSRSEGFSIALMEAMAAGLVPVVSRLPSGMPEMIEDDVTGMMPPPGDVEAFVTAIRRLHEDRVLLESMSHAARTRIAATFDIRTRVRDWQALFARHHELRRPRNPHARLPYGSRLDRPWLPNTLVRAVRTLRRRHVEG